MTFSAYKGLYFPLRGPAPVHLPVPVQGAPPGGGHAHQFSNLIRVGRRVHQGKTM